MDCLIDLLAEEYESPADFIRSTYKYTSCGASAGLLIEYTVHTPTYNDPYCEESGFKWVYACNLSWDALRQYGRVTAISVNSIVEGIDNTTETYVIRAEEYDTNEAARAAWEEAVAVVEAEADYLWNDTHGCAWCERDPADIPADADAYDDTDSMSRINSDCRVCDGQGIIL